MVITQYSLEFLPFLETDLKQSHPVKEQVIVVVHCTPSINTHVKQVFAHLAGRSSFGQFRIQACQATNFGQKLRPAKMVTSDIYHFGRKMALPVRCLFNALLMIY